MNFLRPHNGLIEYHCYGKKSQSFDESDYSERSGNSLGKSHKKVERILIIKRIYSPDVTAVALRLINYLRKTYKIKCVVEPSAVNDYFELGVDDILTWRPDENVEKVMESIDFIITVGGDGTILHASQLFSKKIAPIIGVCMGSLGFLNQFRLSDLSSLLKRVILYSHNISFKSRLTVKILNIKGQIIKELSAVNECVVDRGPSPFLTTLDVYCGTTYLTTICADGLIIATPSGSTAYCLSAGGPIVHPEVPCMILTPVCPHTLSLRPLVLPENVTLVINVPVDSRDNAWVAVDGKNRCELHKGMSVVVLINEYPLPLVSGEDNNVTSWLKSLIKLLNWNKRPRQIPLHINEIEGSSIIDNSCL